MVKIFFSGLEHKVTIKKYINMLVKNATQSSIKSIISLEIIQKNEVILILNWTESSINSERNNQGSSSLPQVVPLF